MSYTARSQQNETLAKIYPVERCQANLDSRCDIKKMPGDHPGGGGGTEPPLKEITAARN